MKIVHHFKKHSKTVTSHVKKHHKKYLAGLFGGFAVAKLFALVIGLSTVQYTLSTHAQQIDDCVMTGGYYTGEYQTGCVEIPEELTGGYYENCETLPGYRTGGTLSESGELIDQVWVEEQEINCVLTGQILVPAHVEGCYMTGGYWTGGTLLCEDEPSILDDGGEEIVQGDIEPVVCTSGDITWLSPLSGNSVRGIFDVVWNIGDCVFSGATLQLWDHNAQWVDLTDIIDSTSGYSFDSSVLYTFQQSGLYHVVGTGMSGEQYYLYTGTYTGTYTRFFSGYMMRLLAADDVVLAESAPFTIDNQSPYLTGLTLNSGTVSSGYVGMSGNVTLQFIASESLSGVTVSLGTGISPSTTSVSGLVYTYTRVLTSLVPQGPLVARVDFADAAGNTGSNTLTSTLVFDAVSPTPTGFVFSGNTSGVQMNFVVSEPTSIVFGYVHSGSASISGTISQYLSAHVLSFSGIQTNTLTYFDIRLFDQANNSRQVTGDFVYTSTGAIFSHVNVVPVVSQNILSGNIASLATVLKAEVEKFSDCKNSISYTPVELKIRNNDFLLHMPAFQKSQVKILVNAFALYVLDNLKSNPNLSKSDLEEITKKFDNFLVVLKLFRDDDNECKQNLSNYHINQFKTMMAEYKITLE